ncbi:MAG: response regulator transcription factor [Casimicrobiaceae bacterium]
MLPADRERVLDATDMAPATSMPIEPAPVDGPQNDERGVPHDPADGQLTLRVLLIEDSPLIRERLAETIAEPGRIEVVGQADSEQAAVGLLVSTAWHAMVLDLQLRHGTGLGVLRALVSMRPAGARVIVLTNYAFPQYRAKSLALGADHFLDKAREYHRVREILDGLARERVAGVH